MGLLAIPAIPCVPGTPRGPNRGVEGARAGISLVWERRKGDEGGLACAGDGDEPPAIEQEEQQHAPPGGRSGCGAYEREGQGEDGGAQGEEAVGILGVGREAAGPAKGAHEGERDAEGGDCTNADGA